MCTDGHAAFVAGKTSQCFSEQTGDGMAGVRPDSGITAEQLRAQRNKLLACMGQQGASLLDMHLRTASFYLQQLNAGAENASQAAAQEAVLAALDATAAAVAWLPLSVMHHSALREACTALVQAAAFRDAVVEILMQASSRSSKQADSDAEHYAHLFSHIAGLLVTACQVMVPESHTADHFEQDVAAASAAKRLAEVQTAFVLNGHLAKATSSDSQLQVRCASQHHSSCAREGLDGLHSLF